MKKSTKNMKGKALLNLFIITFFLVISELQAQTSLHISGPQRGFPIAVPALCNKVGGGGDNGYSTSVPDRITKDLEFSGIFRVINPSSFVESPGKCETSPDSVSYSDWSVIGAETLVKGEIKRKDSLSDSYIVDLYLYDVFKQKPELGKRYEVTGGDFKKVADRFANEIIAYFTGTPGIFGSKIAYTSRVGRFKELFVMDLDGSSVRQLTNDKGIVVAPSWAPNREEIVYTSYKTRRPNLYTISASGGAVRTITRSDHLVIGAKYLLDGSGFITASSMQGISNLVVLNNSGNLVNFVTKSSAIDVSPSLSPDGTQVAFCSNRSGGPQIYIMPTSGSNPKRFSFTGSNYCTSPSWSPKGDKIAFVCRENGHQLFIMNTDGTGLNQITFRGSNEDPSFSPDGRYLAFSSDAFGRSKGIVVLVISTGKITRISPTNTEDTQPSWSRTTS